MYLEGDGGKRDDTQAVISFQNAADNGHSQAGLGSGPNAHGSRALNPDLTACREAPCCLAAQFGAPIPARSPALRAHFPGMQRPCVRKIHPGGR